MTPSRRIPVLQWLTLVVLVMAVLAPVTRLIAQGVTTGSISGTVMNGTNPVAGASIIAIH